MPIGIRCSYEEPARNSSCSAARARPSLVSPRARHSSSTTPRSLTTSSGSSVAADSHSASTSRPVSRRVTLGRDVEPVDRLVVARARVDVAAELRARAPQDVDEVVLREARSAVEQHVLEEVGDARLRCGLVPGACPHGEPELRRAAGALVVTDVVREAVRKRPCPQVGVTLRDRRQRVERRAGGRRLGRRRRRCGRPWFGRGRRHRARRDRRLGRSRRRRLGRRRVGRCRRRRGRVDGRRLARATAVVIGAGGHCEQRARQPRSPPARHQATVPAVPDRVNRRCGRGGPTPRWLPSPPCNGGHRISFGAHASPSWLLRSRRPH